PVIQVQAADGRMDVAQATLDKFRDQMPGETVAQLEQHLKGAGERIAVGNSATSFLSSPNANAQPAAYSGNIADAIHAQESGGAATAGTSVAGAQGGWQIMPATFQQYKQPGENINNPADNEAVGRRIVADYSQRFGGDPAKV